MVYVLEKLGTFPLQTPTMDLGQIPQKYWVFGDKKEGGVYRPRGYDRERGRMKYVYHPQGLDTAWRATGHVESSAIAEARSRISQSNEEFDPEEAIARLAASHQKRTNTLQQVNFEGLILQAVRKHYRAQFTQAQERLAAVADWPEFHEEDEGNRDMATAIKEVREVSQNLLAQVLTNPYRQSVIRITDEAVNPHIIRDSQNAPLIDWMAVSHDMPPARQRAAEILVHLQTHLKTTLDAHQDPSLCCPTPKSRAA